MEALKNLNANVPDWLKRLDDLNDEIEKRQVMLAQVVDSHPSDSPEGLNGGSAPAPRSIRNKGSTESLRPKDEPAAYPRDATPVPDHLNTDVAAAAAAGAAAAKANLEEPAPPSPADSQSPSAIQRRTTQVQAAGRARARATLRKRQRTDSVVSAEGAAPKYRTRSMIIVYYDSYVQSFFEELVKFVSASRNMMRKAKMAAKVAQIRRLAELEMPDDDEDGGNDQKLEAGTNATPNNGDSGVSLNQTVPAAASPTTVSNGLMSLIQPSPAPANGAEEEIPALPFVSTRRMGPGGSAALMMARTSMGRGLYARAGARGPMRGMAAAGGPAPDQQADVYDELDKGLEYVQSMCEHAAHQFLRDGDCAEEVANIQRRLKETGELAEKEMARVLKEQPDMVKAVEDEPGVRTYRPQSMRRDISAKDSKPDLTVDDANAEQDTAVPKLMYRSTRMMT